MSNAIAPKRLIAKANVALRQYAADPLATLEGTPREKWLPWLNPESGFDKETGQWNGWAEWNGSTVGDFLRHCA